jgi:hypothetical protein
MYHHIDERFFVVIDTIAADAGLPRPYMDGVTYRAKPLLPEELLCHPLGGIIGPREPRLTTYRGLPGEGGLVGDRLYAAVRAAAGGGPNRVGAIPW